MSDRSLALAMPLATYPRGGLGELALAEWLAQVMQEHEASRVVIGVPLNMNGSAGPRAAHAQGVADALAARGVAVTLQDERLSTVEAEAHLRRAGRRAKNQRAVVDQAAAVIILQAALDAHRNVTKR